MAGDVFVRWRICCTYREHALALLYQLLSQGGHTCDNGSIAASGVPLASMLIRFGVSVDCADGDAGLRILETSLLFDNGPMKF